jgi:hypothetical protein
MARFLALYIGSVSASEKASYSPTLDEEKMWADGMTQWGQWAESHSSAIVDPGTPLGKTLRASPDGISAHENRNVAYVIVEAESLQAAAQLFKDHPHFAVMPGDSIEIMECLPPPGQG